MLALKAKKENVIIVPNRDKLPIGKIKDVTKLINVVSAEYGIEEDLKYFGIEKAKYATVFKLQFIPRSVSEVRTVTAKKFIVYDLVKNGHGCTMKIDEDLNKKALVINDLLSTIDDKCKETITAKLESMFEVAEELDFLLDELLTDPQYNSFKYTVLDSSKTSCLLCVNSYGLFIRSLEAPYDVSREVSWQDIVAIKTKANRLIFRKKNGESEDIGCINKKTVLAAHGHLVKYLLFIKQKESTLTGDNRRGKTSWFGSFALRIRQSFSRRPRTNDSGEPQTSAYSAPNKSSSSNYRENAPPNSTVPGSSVVSEDCLDNVGSLMMEPSIRTNSTHDVSLGSASSFRPSMIRLTEPEDRGSVKTTSTYEVNLDSVSMQRTLPGSATGGGRSDHDSVALVVISDNGGGGGHTKDEGMDGNIEDIVEDYDDGVKETGGRDDVREKTEEAVQSSSAVVKMEDRVPLSSDDSLMMEGGVVLSQVSPLQALDRDIDAGNDREAQDSDHLHRSCAARDDRETLIEGSSMEENGVLREETVTGITDRTEEQRSMHERKSVSDAATTETSKRSSHNGVTEDTLNPPSPSDKENYNAGSVAKNNGTGDMMLYPDYSDDNNQSRNKSANFSRFENEEYVVDSKTTLTSVSTTADSITKKLIKTEISSVKASGIPTPKQYKTTTTITSTVKKPSDGSKSPVASAGVSRSSGIPRMASK